jgi:hypothetical protein
MARKTWPLMLMITSSPAPDARRDTALPGLRERGEPPCVLWACSGKALLASVARVRTCAHILPVSYRGIGSANGNRTRRLAVQASPDRSKWLCFQCSWYSGMLRNTATNRRRHSAVTAQPWAIANSEKGDEHEQSILKQARRSLRGIRYSVYACLRGD